MTNDLAPSDATVDGDARPDDMGVVQSMHAAGLALDEIAQWLDGPHTYPLDDADRDALHSAVGDLAVRVRQFAAEPALFTVMLVGGTGVGKSTLLNALAGERVAKAGLVRPTTQHPTVYHHRAVSLDGLDPVFAGCHAAPHDRAELRFKIIIDTPDMDGSVLEHRERLKAILPVADAVMYCGSPEKYHDVEVWRILLQHRGTRGFAFVLNKWDRCVGGGESIGRSPDDDFRRSLAEAGFAAPLVFRTAAAFWAEARGVGGRASDGRTADAVGDDFPQLERWIDEGLSAAVMRNVKLRGVAAKMADVVERVRAMLPPDWTPRALELQRDWETALREASTDQTRLLVESADRCAATLESHFRRLSRKPFRGLFGAYLGLVDQTATLWRKVTGSAGLLSSSTDVSMTDVAARCIGLGSKASRAAQTQSMHDHLLAMADRHGWPIETLAGLLPGGPAADGPPAALDEQRLSAALANGLVRLEQDYSDPVGGRRYVRRLLTVLCLWLPPVLLVGLLAKWIIDSVRIVYLWGMAEYLGAAMLVVLTFGGLHALVALLVPVRYRDVRPRLVRLVEDDLSSHASVVYLRLLDQVQSRINAERKRAADAVEVLAGLLQRIERKPAAAEATEAALFPTKTA
ncbi:MAG: GTPase [Planctomycetia bacterium]